MVGVGGRTIKYAADPDMCGLCLECAQPCKQVCLECAQPCKQVCAGCQVARYCSKECARKCWSEHHRRECSSMKLVRAQIVNYELMEASGMRGTKHLETLAYSVATKFTIKNPPSQKVNGRLRGKKKQARCNGGKCANPGAVGIRYVCHYTESELHLLETPAFGKLCACAHAAQKSPAVAPLALRTSFPRRRRKLLDHISTRFMQESRATAKILSCAATRPPRHA